MSTFVWMVVGVVLTALVIRDIFHTQFAATDNGSLNNLGAKSV